MLDLLIENLLKTASPLTPTRKAAAKAARQAMKPNNSHSARQAMKPNNSHCVSSSSPSSKSLNSIKNIIKGWKIYKYILIKISQYFHL
jgi:hypothetical protein